MNALTQHQINRCAQLLEVIVRPGDHNFGWAIVEAQKIFGYEQPETPKTRKAKSRSRYYAILGYQA